MVHCVILPSHVLVPRECTMLERSLKSLTVKTLSAFGPVAMSLSSCRLILVVMPTARRTIPAALAAAAAARVLSALVERPSVMTIATLVTSLRPPSAAEYMVSNL